VLANNATANTTANFATATALVVGVTTSLAAWVRVYTDAASQSADASRLITADPAANAGVLLEFATSASMLSLRMAPSVVIAENDPVSNDGIYPVTITNLSGGSGNVSVQFTYIKLQG
jgi:hypothetical protein